MEPTIEELQELSASMPQIETNGILTEEQEKNLILKFQEGDLTALSELLEANIRFVITIAKLYENECYFLEMREIIAHYDNATRYNDDVIRQLVSMYQDQNTVMVYLSDHGEEVYDYRDNYGRDDWSMGNEPQQVLRYQYMVPMVVWCSDKYLTLHPEMAELLKQSADKPFMLDNTCHLLFRLANLLTPYYNNRRDILSPDYKCPKRIINDQFDYDEVMANQEM